MRRVNKSFNSYELDRKFTLPWDEICKRGNCTEDRFIHELPHTAINNERIIKVTRL